MGRKKEIFRVRPPSTPSLSRVAAMTRFSSPPSSSGSDPHPVCRGGSRVVAHDGRRVSRQELGAPFPVAQLGPTFWCQSTAKPPTGGGEAPERIDAGLERGSAQRSYLFGAAFGIMSR